MVGIGEVHVEEVGAKGREEAHRTGRLVDVGLLRQHQLDRLRQSAGHLWRLVAKYFLSGQRLVLLTRCALGKDAAQALAHGGIHLRVVLVEVADESLTVLLLRVVRHLDAQHGLQLVL